MLISKNNIGFIIGGIAVVTATVLSCSKDLKKSDPNVENVDGYFKTSAEILNATNSIYSAMHSQPLVAREWFFIHDLRGDQVSSGGGQLEAPRAQILNGGSVPSNGIITNQWSAIYTMIHRANTVIGNAANATDNVSLTARNVGEAKFLRAWAYNELVTMWGAVPLYTRTVKTANEFQSRAKEADVYALIVQDLKDAVAALPEKSAYGASDLGRPTKSAANALLGRVYMQTGDYASAKTAFLLIPTSGADGYSLTSRWLDNFEEETEFNNESIFEVVFYDKGDNNFNWAGDNIGDGPAADQSTVRNQEYCGVAWRNLIPSNTFLNEFENTATGAAKSDPRFHFSVYQTGDLFNKGASTLTDAMQNGNSSILNGVTQKISWRKWLLMYKEKQSFHPGGNNQRLIRYAEILLDLAECENELTNSGPAIGYLNQVRDRPDVAMPHYPTTQFPCGSKDEITKAIMHERNVELGDEEVRNIDIIRWRKKGYFTTDPLSYFKPNRDELLPIPQDEIDNNPKLGAGGINAQNPGY
ncbi:RagB/SusD family nutrient uptake outer membrane protein [Flavitalea flava]